MTAAAPVTDGRGYAGADTVAPEVAGPDEASGGSTLVSPPPLEPGAGEVLPVPVPPAAAAPKPAAEPAAAARRRLLGAPGPVSGAAPGGSGAPPTSGEPRPGEPRPKWWGPYPRPKLTGFGGPVLQLTGLDGNFAAMVGLAGGLSIRQRVAIGATGMWLLNPSDAGRTSVGAPRRLNANFGGLLLAVVFARAQRADFTLEAIVGGGGACLQNPETGTCYDRTAMFVAQPSLGVHVRLAPIVRLVLGFGYRVVVARSWSGPDGRAMSAPVGTVMLELGLF